MGWSGRAQLPAQPGSARLAVVADRPEPEPDTTEAARERPPRRHRRHARRPGGRSLGPVGLAFLAYLALSVLLWWQVWSTHPTTVTTCACGDTSLFLWCLEWPAYAIAHGHDPFFSSYLFHPTGIDLLSNTSVLAVGIPLAPVTWLFGPVATLNVASTLAPALAGTSMFWLVRRYVAWAPAAFVAGLVFGFSTFAIVNLVGSHLMTGVLALLPLIVASLDELLVRQRRGAVGAGIGLGLLVTVEFFVSTEMLMVCAICTLIALVLLLAYAAVAQREAVRARAGHAVRGAAAAAVSAGCLLGYPLWFALDGPAHLSGQVWPNLPAGSDPAHLSSMLNVTLMGTSFQHLMRVWGGYQGPQLPLPEFIGLGAVVVIALALVTWRDDRRLWFFGALGVASGFLSLGLAFPWHLLEHVALVQDVFAGHFEPVTDLCVAVLVAIAVDRARGWAARRIRRLRREAVLGVLVPSAAAVAVSAAALVPMALALAPNTPITAVGVVTPPWFGEAGAHLPPGQVVFAYPAPFTVVESAMAWQALDGMRFAMAGGSGPGGVLSRAGRERPGMLVLRQASVSFSGPPALTNGNVEAVRAALTGWGVTIVVIPDPKGLPLYDQGTNLESALRLFTAAIGRGPTFEDHAWVWTQV